MNLNHCQKLGLPVALGLCAAFLNWVSVSRTLEPRQYIALVRALPPGEPIKLDDLQPVSISHTRDVGLETTLIPWDRRQLLEGRLTQRFIAPNHLLTHFDVATEMVVKVDESVGPRELAQIFVGDQIDLAEPDDPKRKILIGCRLLSQFREGGTLRVRIAVDPAQCLNLPGGISLKPLRLTPSQQVALGSK